MNSTVGRGEWVAAEALSVLPAQLTSLPALAAAVAVIAACVWFSSGADDFGRLPGPPSDSWLLGSMKKVGMRREAQLRTATERGMPCAAPDPGPGPAAAAVPA